MATKPVVNVEDVEPVTFGNGGRYEGRFRWVSRMNGAQQLGYNFAVLAPGKTAFPYHFHRGIEEAFFVTEGTGELRYDGKEYTLRPGDIVCCPPGKGSAHQITNNGDVDLKYLAFSSKPALDIVQYPDSGKVGAMCAPDPAEPGAPPFRIIVKDDAGIDYWEGEG